jgi:uncharacterized protein YkwD
MKRTVLACVLLIAVLVSGCGRTFDNGGPSPSLSFAESEMTFNVGDVVSLALAQNGYEQELSFESSDDSIVSVTSDGIATAHAVGVAVITTHMGVLSATLNITVVLPRAIMIELSRNVFSIGDTVTFDVIDNYGSGEPYIVKVTLDDSDIELPEIQSNSFVVNVAGFYTITAVVGDVSTRAQFVVFDLELFMDETLALVNEERAFIGIAPLYFDDALIMAADIRVKELSELFSHTRPNGEHFSTAFLEAGVEIGNWGENLALGQKTPEEVVKMWMESDSHSEALLDTRYRHTGIGIYMADDGRTFWAQTFSS